MLRWWCILLTLIILSGGCSTPQPRPPQQIARAEPSRPSWVERLQLPETKARRATILSARVSDAFKEYNAARLALLDEVLREIKTGKLNRDQLEPLAERAILEFEQALPVLLNQLNELHALLSPEERQRMIEMFGGKQEKNDTERHAERQQRFARVLDLTSAQKARLYPTWLRLWLSNFGLLNGMMRDFKDARVQFASDTFDARTLPLVNNLRPKDVLELSYETLTLTLPVLSSAQHQTLAAYLDARLR